MKRINKVLCFLLAFIMALTLFQGLSTIFIKSASALSSEEQAFKAIFDSANTGYKVTPKINHYDSDYQNYQNIVNDATDVSYTSWAGSVSSVANATVLMHGYGANNGVWSNDSGNGGTSNGKYYELSNNDLDNIIKATTSVYLNVDLFVVTATNEIAFNSISVDDLNSNIKINKLANDYSYNVATNGTEIGSVNLYNEFDLTKHTIFIFDIKQTSESNNNTYFLYNYALSKIALAMKTKSGTNTLPKFNLIGHSRGGIINLMYALDHPDMVENLISIGTPYNGSTTAQVFGEYIEGGMTDALKDIIDSDVYGAYRTRWNYNYNSRYQNIKVTAIGSYCSFAFIGKMARCDEKLTNFINTRLRGEGYAELSQLKVALIVDAGLTVLGVAKIFIESVFGFVRNMGRKSTINYLRKMLPKSKAVALAKIFFNEIVYDESLLSWQNDFLVDLESQLGYEYIGFDTITRKFTHGQKVFNRLAMDDVPVPHNLETMDKTIVNDVKKVLEPTSKIFYQENGNNTVTISGFSGNVFNGSGTNWNIPSTIDGYTVTGIDSYALSKDFGRYGITSITLPSSITTIDDYAFYGAKNIEHIYLTSNVTYIGDGAFAGCEDLLSISIPSSVTYLGDGVLKGCSSMASASVYANVSKLPDCTFSGCSSLTSVTLNGQMTEIGVATFNECEDLATISLPSNVTVIPEMAFYKCSSLNITIGSNITEIGDYAFAYCESLTLSSLPNSVTKLGDCAFTGCAMTSFTVSQYLTEIGENCWFLCEDLATITVSADNPIYSSLNGVLYDDVKKILLSYPVAKQDTSFTVPEMVETINSKAFTYNENIVTLNLNNAKYVGIGAFAGCSSLATITANNVEAVAYDSFAGTAWLETHKTDTFVSIGKCLLKYNGSASVLDLSSYVYIDDDVFETYDFNETPDEYGEYPKLSNNTVTQLIFGENTDYVGMGVFENCTALESITVYSNRVLNVADYYLSTTTVSAIDYYVANNLISAYTQNGRFCDSANAYSPITTQVNYYNGNTLVYTDTAYYGQYYELYKYYPSYGTFNCWKDGTGANAQQVTNSLIWEERSATVNLYAEMVTKDCSVTYNVNGGQVEQSTVYFSSGTTYTLSIPAKEGYSFAGWYTDANLTNYAGVSLSPTVATDYVLYAKWETAQYSLYLICPLWDSFWVEYGYVTQNTLPTVNISGIDFYGWYTLPRNGVMVANASGTVVGTLTDGMDLYARLPTYSVNYVLNGGINSQNNVSDYDFYMGTFEFYPATKTGYRFLGWKDSNGNYIESIDDYVRTDITIYACYAKEYTLKFQAGIGTPCADIVVVQGEEITLPTSTHTFYVGYWEINGINYSFGDKYVFNIASVGYIDVSNIKIHSSWVGKYFHIHYKYVNKYTWGNEMYYHYGDELILTGIRTTTSGYVFENYYYESDFSGQPVKTIPANPGNHLAYDDTVGDYIIKLYVKYTEIELTSMNRTYTRTVTPSGYTPSNLDSLYVSLDYTPHPEYAYYTSIRFVVEVEAWEVSDCREDIYLCNENTLSTAIRTVHIYHQTNVTNTNHHIYQFEWIVDIDDTYYLQEYDKYSHRFYFICGANGNSDSKWKNKNFKVKIQLTNYQIPNGTTQTITWNGI